MRQMFTCPLKDTSKESIEAAYREIWNEGTAIGFTSMREDGIVKQTRDGKYYLDVPMYTADESKLIV